MPSPKRQNASTLPDTMYGSREFKIMSDSNDKTSSAAPGFGGPTSQITFKVAQPESQQTHRMATNQVVGSTLIEERSEHDTKTKSS